MLRVCGILAVFSNRANADIKWTLMIVLCSYTGFILLSSSIITIYVYLGFDYWQDQNSFTQDKWSDNGARNKFQGAIVLGFIASVLHYVFVGFYACCGESKPKAQAAETTPNVYKSQTTNVVYEPYVPPAA
mmetsp:Transcript_7293/g.26866  ORF Transcript_7293/g.26866 Transcript_7293/m.26866 type:complete len:131 (+) Transcript_7293:504-896(+)